MDPMQFLDFERRTGLSPDDIDEFADRMDKVRSCFLYSFH